jgi:hypothetical protein
MTSSGVSKPPQLVETHATVKMSNLLIIRGTRWYMYLIVISIDHDSVGNATNYRVLPYPPLRTKFVWSCLEAR